MSQQENALSVSASSYLRSARHQPVNWLEWSPEAFALAQQQNKPILLDVGAVWCQWCHVMDRESYSNPDTAHVINEFFIPIRVDRDERPDIDARYQSAVAAISGQGGWPLTAFLTPQGKPYFGGTYFPAEERYGRPSFQRVLVTMADAFAHKRDEVEESADSVMDAIAQSETYTGHSGLPDAHLLNKLIDSTLQQFDERYGGFGSQPKFPHAGALELLIDAASRNEPHSAAARHAVTTTLRSMAAGGIYDHLAGGFHRYSIDEKWIVPHFEKMACDNSELLKVYAHAFQASADPAFAATAIDIIRWMDNTLTDRNLGGFYASQSAGSLPSDNGDSFTWTLAEVEAALTPEDFVAASNYFNLRVIGDMQHNPQKNVLHLRPGASLPTDTLQRIQSRLLAARSQRPAPFLDKTLYTGWNAMCISAYLQAGRALNLDGPVAFALKSLDRLLAAAWDPTIGLAHVIAYAEAPTNTRTPAILEDYAATGIACLHAFDATANPHYLTTAQQVADALLDRFADIDPATNTCTGFFDIDHHSTHLGALTAPRKPLQDSPTPAGNGTAATLLLRLHTLTGNDLYRTRAVETLAAFAGVVEHLGLYVATYGQALRLAISHPTP